MPTLSRREYIRVSTFTRIVMGKPGLRRGLVASRTSNIEVYMGALYHNDKR
jgi:hypothetical protein